MAFRPGGQGRPLCRDGIDQARNEARGQARGPEAGRAGSLEDSEKACEVGKRQVGK